MEKKEQSFEESLLQLEGIVRKLEGGDIPLDEAIARYTDAMHLSKVCSAKLKNAEEAITKIVKEDGSIEEFENIEE